MVDTTTTNYAITKIGIGESKDTWGSKLNTNMDTIDAAIKARADEIALRLLASGYTAADVLAKLLTVDGAGSNLDADTVDGIQAAAFLLAASYTAADVLTKLMTVDGTGSGLDADLLDGLHAAAFSLSGHTHSDLPLTGGTISGPLAVTGTFTLGGVALAATADELNRTCDISTRIVNCTAASLSIVEATHEGKTVTINRAAGCAITLPAATGGGARYRIRIGTSVSSNSITVKVANSSDVMTGTAMLMQDAGDTIVGFNTTGTSDTITMDGSTTGGLMGAWVDIEDIASNLWHVRYCSDASGTEATPFSATV